MKNKIMVTKSSMPEYDEYIEEIKSLWDTHWLTNMGEKHRILEEQLKDYLKVNNISLYTNGHMALELAIQAFNLTGEVITTPFTFVSTTNAIIRNGLKPVFCDINPDDYTMDVTKIESLITDKTSAIVPVHVYGNICDVEKIEEIAKRHNLKVIYDAAHTFGVEYKGRGIGTYGDASMFSFHATKVFNTIEGGAVVFADEEIKKVAEKLRNFGICSEETIEYVGSNAKMNEFQAAMGICNLRHVDEEISKRKKIVERYNDKLGNIEGIKTNKVQKDVVPNYAYYPVVFSEKKLGVCRDEIYEELKKNNIYSRKYFYPLTNNIGSLKGAFNVEDTPVALDISNSVLTLPLYADLALRDVDRICEVIINYINKGGH